jgi:hypothetical protein
LKSDSSSPEVRDSIIAASSSRLRALQVYDGVMPADTTKTSSAAKKQRAKKQLSRDRKQQDLDPREELLPPTASEYGMLCQLAFHMQQLSPWIFMQETDVFGFQDPESGALGFVSVMGQLGEFQAISVYRGVEGLYSWRNFEELLQIDAKSDAAHDMVYEIPQVQLAFVEPTILEKRDRDIIKASGFKFSITQLPQFRSYRPGYLPWFLTREEASHLIYALTQTINVASRFFSEADVIPFNEGPEDRDYLIRTPRLKDSIPYWEDSIVTLDPPPTQLLPFSVDEPTLNKLKKFSGSGALEVDLFILPAKVGKSNERPRLLYALLAVDSASDFIVGVELMEAVDGVDLMYASAAETLASHWMQHQIVPKEIRVGSARLLNVLESLASELGIMLSSVKKLPAVNRAKRSMIAHLGG